MTTLTKQTYLKELGYYKGRLDGKYGPLTINAVKGFQKKYSLVVDGKCGPITSKKLIEVWTYNVKNFKRDNFKCGCHGKYCNGFPVEMNHNTVLTMQQISDHFGKSITVTSGVRCKKFNTSLQGSTSNSKHLKGLAVDFTIKGINKNTVLAYVKTLPQVKHAYTNETNMKNGVHINL